MAEKNNNNGLLIDLVLVGVGYFVIVKPILEKFGLANTPAQDAQDSMNTGVTSQASTSMDAVCKATPSTRSDADWLAVADNIYSLTNGVHFFDDDDIIAEITNNVQNDCDMLRLIAAFGTRTQRLLNFIPVGSGTMSQYVINILSTSSIAELNQDLQNKGIVFRF